MTSTRGKVSSFTPSARAPRTREGDQGTEENEQESAQNEEDHTCGIVEKRWAALYRRRTRQSSRAKRWTLRWIWKCKNNAFGDKETIMHNFSRLDADFVPTDTVSPSRSATVSSSLSRVRRPHTPLIRILPANTIYRGPQGSWSMSAP